MKAKTGRTSTSRSTRISCAPTSSTPTAPRARRGRSTRQQTLLKAGTVIDGKRRGLAHQFSLVVNPALHGEGYRDILLSVNREVRLSENGA